MVSREFRFIAADAALDFTNTLVMSGDGPLDLLASFGDLLDWLTQANLVDHAQAREMRRFIGTAKAKKALADARDLRAAIRRASLRLSEGKSVPEATLRTVNDLLAVPLGHPLLTLQGAQVVQSFKLQLRGPHDVLVPIAWAARDLFVFRDPSLIKKCKSDQCVLIFYDRTKNHRRDWCSMSTCGNRAKVSAFRARH